MSVLKDSYINGFISSNKLFHSMIISKIKFINFNKNVSVNIIFVNDIRGEGL
jgi:hypothetical protein